MASGLSFSSKSRLVNLTLTQRSRRAIILMLVSTLLTGVCGLRLAQLQIIQGQYNRQRAEQNRIALIPIPSDRGNILDRNGKLLAANRLSRSVYLRPREQSKEEWKQTAERLSPILKIPAGEILDKLQQAGYRSAMPVRISRNLALNAFITLAENASHFPGLEIRGESSRYYPNGKIAAHVLGYLSEATEADMKAHPDYPLGMLVGQMGIERLADRKLQGTWGGQLVEVDATGREVNDLGLKPPISGESVILTLDLDLQKTAERALGNRRGAVVVLDVKTGAILALASSPTFDPNLFTRRISKADWERLQTQENPFLNRALQGYPPGSTFKVVTAMAGMQSGKFSPNSALMTYAAINLGGHLFHEHGNSGYGVLGFRDALAFSSNTFFYQVGLSTGPEAIAQWSHQLGIGTTDLGLSGGSHGIVPTPAEKEKLFKEPWYGGDTVSMSIGQGLVQATPLELAVTYAAIANGGWRVKPHLLRSQTNEADTRPKKIGVNPAALSVIRDGLTAVVQEGTARRLNDGSIPLTAGKTGTAEVLGQRDNSLFAGFGPVAKPQIALAVVVENGGYGAEAAVPIAHEIYKTYFKKTSKR
ncbi:penicillin-binding protein 2 [Leptodesmis sichuanensis]|uniref:penicillin-binding protein 2 n=1 Tax=Leptodesmis sichuanensis TaxID=2906798 RepID=UPI001F1688D4|nr:penicillin-binding protein 2 [Leptodesmis sichuanensis]UIE38802.1 penicillin-binding protein 2 [Leptodesmis sichuanensis A121]